MERESFESEAVADVLNAGFISIKVDREERPDVDKVYVSPASEAIYVCMSSGEIDAVSLYTICSTACSPSHN